MSVHFKPGEARALALAWVSGRVPEADQKEILDSMSRGEQRRFSKLLEEAEQKKLHDGERFVTGRQLAQYFASYTERHLMPVAANLDELATLVAFMRLPFYRRWWAQIRFGLSRINQWLGRHGLRFVQHNPETEDDGDSQVQGGPGAQRGEPEGAGGEGGEVRDGHEQPRLHRDGDSANGAREEPGDDRAGPGSGRTRIGQGGVQPCAEEEGGREEGPSEEEGSAEEEVGVRHTDRRSVAT